MTKKMRIKKSYFDTLPLFTQTMQLKKCYTLTSKDKEKHYTFMFNIVNGYVVLAFADLTAQKNKKANKTIDNNNIYIPCYNIADNIDMYHYITNFKSYDNNILKNILADFLTAKTLQQ